MAEPTKQSAFAKLPLAIKIVLALLAVNVIYGAVLLFRSGKSTTPSSPVATPSAPVTVTPKGDTSVIEIGIAYGTEKQRWLQWCTAEFAKTPESAGIKINLIPMGSLEGAQAIVREDKRIHVWSPASALYREQFERDWNTRFGNKVILKEERLALSPMVFVTWQERYDAFITRHKEMSFATISEALQEPTGWAGIANKPEWGVFKFGHTHPGQSNSGLAALVIMGYDYHKKNTNLTLADVLDAGFQKQMNDVERGVSGMSHSTGTMMRDMVLFGPSTFDCLFVYESVVIDYLDNAAGRWGKLQVVYPKHNIWNDNPYYVLDVPWSDAKHRKAAETFLQFLMSLPAQQQALQHGFRPGNASVPTNATDSPFSKYRDSGLTADLAGTICQTPKAEVMFNLLQSWERSIGSR